MPALLALLSSLLWGSSDFLGGALSRRLPVATVLGLSQLTGLVLLVPVAVLTGALDTDRSYVVPAMAAGLTGLVALGMFYRALSLGTMGVVAPVAALGVAVPVVVGLARGEQPTAWQLAGIAVAVVGVVMASGPELSMRAGLQPLLLAVGAAVGFGVVMLLVAQASADASGAVVMTLLTMRATSVSVLLVLLMAFARRARIGAEVRDLPLLMLTGACDAAANGTYALASRSSLLSVAAVLASLYPVITALLAYRVLAERLRPIQWTGVAASLVGVGLLAGG